MTPEEIQRTIEGMLAVQKELQNSQLRFDSSLDRLGQDISELRGSISELRGSISELRESTSELRESVTDLKDVSQRHERRIEQLIGYSITGESDHLDLLGRLTTLERRVNRLEQDNHGVS